MLFWDAVRVLVRRWRVVAPLVLLSLVASLGAYTSVPAKYRAQATILLLMPSQPPESKGPTNPYLDFQGALFSTADVVTRVLMDDATAERLHGRGDAPKYQVSIGASMSAPIIAVLVEDPSVARTMKTLHDVIDEIQNQLDSRQRNVGAPAGTLIRASVIASSAKPLVLRSAKVRAAAGLAGAGILLTVLFAFLVEGHANRRRARSRRAVPPEPVLVGAEDEPRLTAAVAGVGR